MIVHEPIVIVRSDFPSGIPAEAACPCGARWRRPDEDPQAKTLANWARFHPTSSDIDAYVHSDIFVCPCCGWIAQHAYRLEGRLVCGFCFGIGPDGEPIGKHGEHP